MPRRPVRSKALRGCPLARRLGSRSSGELRSRPAARSVSTKVACSSGIASVTGIPAPDSPCAVEVPAQGSQGPSDGYALRSAGVSGSVGGELVVQAGADHAEFGLVLAGNDRDVIVVLL